MERPNFLIILTDEERYPPSYETEEVKHFRRTQLKGREIIREHGVQFHSHYTAATACTPSRGSILTGQYPSYHGAIRTGANADKDEEFFSWVHHENLPTLGHYFQSIGYQTHYRGKWHISDEDLRDENNKRVKTSFMGNLIEEGEEIYRRRNVLEKFGFSDSEWIGPEPHGIDDSNFGIYRDPLFANQIIDLIHSLDQQYLDAKNNANNININNNNENKNGDNNSKKEEGGEEELIKPFLIFCSLLNPHDILALPGYFQYYLGQPINDPSVPDIPDPPNAKDNFENKPKGLKDGLEKVREAWVPSPHKAYRKFYYFLHKVVDYEIKRIYDALQQSSFFRNTIIVFTSDHGDLLSSHGYSIQKWYNAYDETIKVPFVISSPTLFPSSFDPNRDIYNYPTSSVDLIPTLLSLAGVSDLDQVYQKLRDFRHEIHQPNGFRSVPPLIGNDLSPLIISRSPLNQIQLYSKIGKRNNDYNNNDYQNNKIENYKIENKEEEKYRAIYFMTEDDFLKFPNYDTPLAYILPIVKLFVRSKVNRVRGGCQIEAIVVYLPHTSQLWKFVRFWENSKYWTSPYISDEIYVVNGPDKGKKLIVTDPAPDEYEMYNLTNDPIEMQNLYSNPLYSDIRNQLVEILLEMKAKVRLSSDDNDKLIHKNIPYGKLLGKPSIKPPLSYQLATFAIVGALAYFMK